MIPTISEGKGSMNFSEVQPINLYPLEKRYKFAGQHRSKIPDETISAVLPGAKRYGITRIANITGLDRIGVPVTSVVRPNSKTLSTSSGKGLTLPNAIASGLMEAIELYHAENVILPMIRCAYSELTNIIDTIPIELLGVKKHTLFNPHWPEIWTAGWDLIQARRVAVPFRSVSMSKSDSLDIASIAAFQEDSNGLASGNNLIEAISSALYELVERDGIACAEHAQDCFGVEIPAIRLESIPYPSVAGLIKILIDADIEPRIYDCTTDLKIPVFKCLIFDERDESFGAGGGYGAHLDPEIALIRALTEAIQGRAVIIAGARDDVFKFDIDAIRNSNAPPIDKIIKEFDFESKATNFFNGDIETILERFKLSGISSAIIVDIAGTKETYSVVKAFVPGLEGYRWKNSFKPGRRANARGAPYLGIAGVSKGRSIQLAAGGRA